MEFLCGIDSHLWFLFLSSGPFVGFWHFLHPKITTLSSIKKKFLFAFHINQNVKLFLSISTTFLCIQILKGHDKNMKIKFISDCHILVACLFLDVTQLTALSFTSFRFIWTSAKPTSPSPPSSCANTLKRHWERPCGGSRFKGCEMNEIEKFLSIFFIVMQKKVWSLICKILRLTGY